MIISSGTSYGAVGFTKKEKTTVNTKSSGVMRVLSADNAEDLAFLRMMAKSVSSAMTCEPEFAVLKNRMLETVTDPHHPGIGIAAPQVGISRKIIAVQRLDKPGEPFEFYINPKIISHSTKMKVGGEGCLSVPEISGDVARYTELKIRYRDHNYRLKQETVTGFTAIIFQHEIDHLNGILFTDRIATQE